MVTKSTTIAAYIPRRIKRRMEAMQKLDRRLSFSRMVEEALVKWLPEKEKEMFGDAPPQEEERGWHQTHLALAQQHTM